MISQTWEFGKTIRPLFADPVAIMEDMSNFSSHTYMVLRMYVCTLP